MQQKKQLLIKILTKLKPHRDLADGILALVESGYADEQAIDGVIHVIANSVKMIQNEHKKMVVQK